MLALRSLTFNLVMWLSVLIYAPLVVLSAPVPSLPRYRFITQWARFNLWALEKICGLRYVVQGREHLPTGPAIVLSRHESTWETLALQMILPPQVWVLKRELLWVPFFGWGLAQTEPIAIDRRSGRKALEQVIEQGQERLARGRWVIVFPEGTRMPAGQIGRFGMGGAVLAARTGYPVVPLAHNAGSYWPRRGFIKKPGTITVVIGPTITSAGSTAEDINRLVGDWIRATVTNL